MTNAIHPEFCPLCGAPNACARVADPNAKDCWCTSYEFPVELRARVPEAALGCACVCQNCVEEAASSRRACSTDGGKGVKKD